MNEVALIVVYNHQYNQNIPILEEMYGNRFSSIYHLVPFYQGDKKNVIPVYENSMYFQGYIAQAMRSFYKKTYEHYFFIADDLILNPYINEKNYKDYFKLTKKTCFMPRYKILHDTNRGREGFWSQTKSAFNWKIKIPLVEIENQLPSYVEALKKFQKFGLSIRPLSHDQIWRDATQNRNENSLRSGEKDYHLSYPMVGSYSDIFIIHADVISNFSHYCGVFAATNLFVEIAIPTSLVLSAEDIVIEQDLKKRGKVFWRHIQEHAHEYEKMRTECGGSLQKLLGNWPEEWLYTHPVKLSNWSKK